MTEIIARPTMTIRAVRAADSDVLDVVMGWLDQTEAPKDQIETMAKDLINRVRREKHLPWIVANANFDIGTIPAASFAADFEDVAPTDVLMDIWAERKRHPELGYDAKHDDAHPISHLVNEAMRQLGPLSIATNVLPDQAKRDDLVKAASLIVAAIDKIDRAQDVKTFEV